MAMFESATTSPINFERALYTLTSAGGRISEIFAFHRKYRTIRRELVHYSPYELAELGIDISDVDSIAEELARGRSTRCKLVDLGTKRILRKG